MKSGSLSETQKKFANQLAENWALVFEHEGFCLLSADRTEYEKSSQNPFGVVRYDLKIEITLVGVGKRKFNVRFSRSGKELRFHEGWSEEINADVVSSEG